MTVVIQGTQIAARLCETVSADVDAFKREFDVTPTLAVVLVGDDPASQVYVARKLAKTKEVGIQSANYRLPYDASETILLRLIRLLNEDTSIHGILVQLPLPPHIDASKVLDAIDPNKDVDGFHPVNVGRLSSGTGGLIPCTPLGCMLLLDTVVDDFKGKNAVVIGKSNIVGKPVALLLLERECTVTVTHILTEDLPGICRNADILIVAAGSPGLVRGDWVKPGAIVIDVGITRVELEDKRTRLVGDCAFDELDHAGAITPVPGGVGPMTIACLLSNTMKAARILTTNRFQQSASI
jgi:methylenetetrahydrofolate dehydrogenase (NADP+) / methenyltetrahydrofolate cyclohydrolase